MIRRGAMIPAAMIADVDVPHLAVVSEHAGLRAVPLRRAGGHIRNVARQAERRAQRGALGILRDVVAHGRERRRGNEHVVNRRVGRGRPHRRDEITMPRLQRAAGADGRNLRIVCARRNHFETVAAIRLEAITHDVAIGLAGNGRGVFPAAEIRHAHAGARLTRRVHVVQKVFERGAAQTIRGRVGAIDRDGLVRADDDRGIAGLHGGLRDDNRFRDGARDRLRRARRRPGERRGEPVRRIAGSPRSADALERAAFVLIVRRRQSDEPVLRAQRIGGLSPRKN